MRDISNGDDILNSRDVIARRDELQEEREDLVTALADADEEADNTRIHLAGDPYGTPEEADKAEDNASAAKDAREALKGWDEDSAEELKNLNAFIEDFEGYVDSHGETLIRESYFEDYAREVAEDLHGNAVRNASWPFSCIDWERAASDLQQDYSSADFDGVTYYYRS